MRDSILTNFTKPLLILTFTSLFAVSACGQKSDSHSKSKEQQQAPTSSEQQSEVKTNLPSTAQETQKKDNLATLQRGKRLYKRCVTCHSLEKNGGTKTGPTLYGVFGAKIAANPDFSYSRAFNEADIVWTDENLTEYLRKPAAFVPGTKMSFAGIRKDEDIAAILEYMRSEMASE